MMEQYSVFIATLTVGVLLFIGTLASIVGAFLMYGLRNWIKGLSKESLVLVDRVASLERELERELHDVKIRSEGNYDALSRKTSNLLAMMSDASDMSLGPDEIATRIRSRLYNMGYLKKKGE
jgi:hypothetical protein